VVAKKFHYDYGEGRVVVRLVRIRRVKPISRAEHLRVMADLDEARRLLTVTVHDNSRLRGALEPFAKMMRNSDRQKFANNDWNGELLVERGMASDKTAVFERDMVRAGIVYRATTREGRPWPDDINDLDSMTSQQRAEWERTGKLPWTEPAPAPATPAPDADAKP
jgi:hypothetical protein